MIQFEQENDFHTGAVILVNKPLEWTSFDLVNKIKHKIKHQFRYKKIKVGHAGTLDPLATGLMIVCTGKYTKRIESFQGQVKEYIATLKLGATTPSFDLESEIDQEYPTHHITREMIEEKLKDFLGTIEQRPPDFSAVMVNGKRAYELARKGEQINLKTKTLVIEEIEIMNFDQDELTLRVLCSKGTYIRALARDIGRALESGAHLTALKRTRIGEFRSEHALEIEDFVERIEKL